MKPGHVEIIITRSHMIGPSSDCQPVIVSTRAVARIRNVTTQAATPSDRIRLAAKDFMHIAPLVMVRIQLIPSKT
jgi:hypothetical protein